MGYLEEVRKKNGFLEGWFSLHISFLPSLYFLASHFINATQVLLKSVQKQLSKIIVSKITEWKHLCLADKNQGIPKATGEYSILGLYSKE